MAEGSARNKEAAAVVGTCPFMCPEGERVQRARLRDLAVFERLNGDPRKTSPDLAVKKVRPHPNEENLILILSEFVQLSNPDRTISNKHVRSSDVRPLSVLEDTLRYLLKLMDSAEYPFEVIHDFVFDRMRSIRQDLSMQNLVSDPVIHIYEEMVKFHIVSQFRLRRCTSSSVVSLQHLNMEQLSKTLISLYNLYETNHGANSAYKNEAEFRSFYVLLHLDSESHSSGESLSLWFRRLPSSLLKSKEICFARKIFRCFSLGNYSCFFRTIASEASYLQYCTIEPSINKVRAVAISCINACCYKLHPYPLEQLSKLLMLTESDLERFCQACGLKTGTDEFGDKFLPTKQTTFCVPKDDSSHRTVFPGLQHFERLEYAPLHSTYHEVFTHIQMVMYGARAAMGCSGLKAGPFRTRTTTVMATEFLSHTFPTVQEGALPGYDPQNV